MEPGYYWYFTSPLDAEHWCGDIHPDVEPSIYYIDGRSMSIADISVRVDEVHGKWVGPLQTPPEPK